MGKPTLVENATPLLLPILKREGLELFEIVCKRKQNRLVLEVYISRPGAAVTHDDCQLVSTALSLELEVEDLFADNVVLEVSSVGLDRALKNQRDFNYFKGEIVKIKTRKPLDKKKVVLGEIIDCNENAVTVRRAADQKNIVVEYSNINKAKLEVAF